MADAKPALPRDGTMQVTAKEGIDFLKAEGKTQLLAFQGLAEPETSKPAIQRDGTMAVTAKEGEQLLNSVGGAPDEDAATRGQQRKLDDIKNEVVPESPAKKAKLAKDSTMAVTAKEGKDLLGKEKLGDTRQETARKATNKPAPKRGQTMAKTLEEAKFVLDGKDVDITEGRKTRSQSRPQPPAKTPVKRAGTMQKTAKEGKEYVKRGAPAKGKGKGKGKKPAEDGDKEEEEEKKEEEEEKDNGKDEKDDEEGKDSAEDDDQE